MLPSSRALGAWSGQCHSPSSNRQVPGSTGSLLGESWHPMAHTAFAMTSFFKKEMVPKGHLALADRREAQFRQHCQTHGMSHWAVTSREATAGYLHYRLWSDKHKLASDSPLTGGLKGEPQS